MRVLIALLVAMLIVSRVPYRHWTKISIPIMAITLLTLVFLVVSRPGDRMLIGTSITPSSWPNSL